MSKLSRTKGHAFERYVAQKFRSIFPGARRLLEYQEGVGVDIENTGPLRIQCKAYKDYAPISKINEVKLSGIPCLVTKGDRKTPMIVLSLDDFLRIIEDTGVLHEDRGRRVLSTWHES